MRRVLLLGGTGEGVSLARRLGPSDVYSVAGLGREPDGLPCQRRTGGFGGPAGLARYLTENAITHVIDATHPYAARISANAHEATRETGIPLWAVRRPGWSAGERDDWRMVDDWHSVCVALAGFTRPLFTLGREPLEHLHAIPPHQHWTIRCLDAHAGNARATVVAGRGPFTLDAERDFIVRGRFDAIVSKNSGGAATDAKLIVARDARLPVIMLRRPSLPMADRSFDDVSSLWAAFS